MMTQNFERKAKDVIVEADQGAEPKEEFRILAGWWFMQIDMKPTHWMPLPEPPTRVSGQPVERPR